MKKYIQSNIEVGSAKVVDDFLIAGSKDAIEILHEAIGKRFTVGRLLMGKELIFNRLNIFQEKGGSVLLNMEEYMTKITKIDINRERRKQYDDVASPEELTRYQELAGQLNFLGHGILPQAGFAASYLQQFLGFLRVSHLVEGNKVLHEITSLKPKIKYIRPSSLTGMPRYLCFSDASQGSNWYGQMGYLSGMHLSAGGEHIYHLVDWHSAKQSRVSFSAIGAEILAATYSADRGSLMSDCIAKLYGSSAKLPLILSGDSHGLYSTIITLPEGKEYMLRPTVARLRDSFELGEIAVMQWIPGKLNLADALTKRNINSYRDLNQVATSGTLPLERFEKAHRVTNSS